MKHRTIRSGITLIEVTIVILISGIAATIVAPIVLDRSNVSSNMAARQQLAALRNAIGLYRVNAGSYPKENELPEAMESMLCGRFPAAAIGAATDRSRVFYDLSSDMSEPPVRKPSENYGWAYKPANGMLALNVGDNEESVNW
ncbi:Type II secretion system protein G precursor [Planctomycetes bacterium CA13]|uniref:Type II secretion system protein G n=1 Tax=Novipirellula herctigrandis TaxID=2527986 RepID=A0A5C5Z1W0_9BACT|nr:Type II secretion system protein G precursor [Planctomycetes bacterium CA13]